MASDVNMLGMMNDPRRPEQGMPASRAGLCAGCAHARVIVSDRGSQFLLLPALGGGPAVSPVSGAAGAPLRCRHAAAGPVSRAIKRGVSMDGDAHDRARPPQAGVVA